jgi:hypothetical protein
VLPHSLKTSALILCLMLACALPLCAGGQQEPRLAEAEKLIQEQDYAGALKLLVAIQRDNPDFRDETTRLLSTVIVERGQQYNTVLAQLVEVLYNEQDDRKAAQLILDLRKIDPTRSVAEASSAADFIKFLKHMEAAGELLAAGKPAEAISMYLLPLTDPVKAGFNMQKPGFDAAGYGTIVTAAVQDVVTRTIAMGSEEAAAAAAISGIPDAVTKLLAGPIDPASWTSFESLVAPLRRAARNEGAIRAAAMQLASLNKSIKEAGKRGDAYVENLIWLCTGREQKSEGIARAIQMLWEDRARSVAESAAASAEASFAKAVAEFDAGGLEPATPLFKDAYARSVLALEAIGLSSAAMRTSAESGWALRAEDASLARSSITRALTLQESAGETDAFLTLIAYRQDLGRLPVAALGAPVPPAGAAAEAAALKAARAVIESRVAEARSAQQEWLARSAAWAARPPMGVNLAPVAESARAVAARFSSFVDVDLQARDLALALRIAEIGGSGFQGRYEAAAALRMDAEDLKNGTKGGGQPADLVGLPELHPELALPVFQTAMDGFTALVADIGAYSALLRREKPYVTSSATFAALFSGTARAPGYDAIVARSREQLAAIAQLIAASQKQTDDAAVVSREGDSWYTQAEASLKKKDLDGAGTLLDKASDSYVRALTFAYTAYAANRLDKDIETLRNRILVERNASAVADAQKALAAINVKFGARDFLGASDDLDKAQAAWAVVVPGEDYQPFQTMRQQIQNALELNQGRDISRLDAKAEVVNTYMKYALDAQAAGNLKEADQNVKNALAVAPSYGAAKVLALAIKKQLDPAGFQKEASAQIAIYTKMASDKGNAISQREAYNALRDYASLDAKLATQLKNVLLELEYDLGTKRRPPTAREIADSNRLVQQANAKQLEGTMDAFQQALALLRQAYQLYPANPAAIKLDGQIRGKMGSTALTALAAADSERFREAQRLYISGAYQKAYDLVLALWDDPRSPKNKTYDPLAKLKKRCEQVLNI